MRGEGRVSGFLYTPDRREEEALSPARAAHVKMEVSNGQMCYTPKYSLKSHLIK